MIRNTQELKDAFALKAGMAGLQIDCHADGFFQSEIAIIAEAPGEQEVLAKSPLVGGSGRLLWDTLRSHSISRSDCYITNVAKRQVAFDIDERRAPLGRHEYDMWAELLQWELLQLPNLRIVVALGNFALKAMTGHDGITKWRGSVLPGVLNHLDETGQRAERRVQVVCSFNPALVMREPKNQLIFNHDMSRVRRVREGRWKDHPIHTIVNPSLDDAVSYIRSLRSDGAPVAYDIEIIGGETACVGLANNGHEAMSINYRTRNEHRFTVPEELLLRRELAGLFADPEVKLIAQNNMFDASWLWFKDKIKVQPIWMDTMLGHHCLYPQMPHNLGYLCTQYTTHPYYKDEKDAWREGGDIDTFWEYNGKDCCVTWTVAHGIQRELEQQNLSEFFHSHVMRAQPHLIRMVVGGILIDVPLKEKIRDDLRAELANLKEEFYRTVQEVTGVEDYRPNPLSPRDLSDLLFNKLKLVGRGPSTNDENRQRMYKDHRTSLGARQILDHLDKYKEEQKFFSTYVETEIDEDQRIRCEYKQTGVQKAPGRLSSSKVLWGHYDLKERKYIQHGMNLQNQPKRAYEMFIADEGYTFFYFDGSQAEARFVGWDAGIAEWIEQYEQARLDGKYDAHRALASSMFGVPYDDVPTADEEDGRKTIRYIAKRCRHGLNYRMMPDRLASTTGLSLPEAQRAFDLYHRRTPELRKWWRELEDEVRSTRFLYNAYGRRLFIQGRFDDPETMESIVAYKPQSTIGDKITRVIYLCESDPRWPTDARIAMNVHDALVGLAPVDKARECLEIAKLYLEEPLMVKGKQLIIPGDFAIAEPDETGKRRWSTLEKLKDVKPASTPEWMMRQQLRVVG